MSWAASNPGRFWTATWLIAAAAWPVLAQPSDATLGSKADPEVIEAVESGLQHRFLVELDVEDLYARERTKRDARGLAPLHERLQAETREELRQLRESIFPQGEIGEARVAQAFTALPYVVVIVPHRRALERLASHPRIKRIHRTELYKPALTNAARLR